MNSIHVTSFYAALLGIMFIAITLRVATYRKNNRISLGDGGDKELGKLIRGHGNFAETVPLSLLLILILELQGGSSILLHALGMALVCGRVLHYLRLTSILKNMNFRVVGMVLTLSTILVSSVLVLIGSFS